VAGRIFITGIRTEFDRRHVEQNQTSKYNYYRHHVSIVRSIDDKDKSYYR